MAGGKRSRGGDELGALYCSVVIPTCQRRGRAAITEVDVVLHVCATPLSLYHVVVTVASLELLPLSHCADERHVWWTPVMHHDATIIRTSSKFGATAVGPYKLTPPPPPPVPLVCYEPRELPLASDWPP
jgi:hypothetical protein